MMKVRVRSGQVLVKDLVIASREVADYLKEVSEPDRARTLVRATEVGVFCLERAVASRDLDFVRQQLDQQLRLVTAELEKIPAKVQQELLKHVGTEKGQVLAPLAATVATTDKIIREKLTAVHSLFDGHIDPRRADTTLGRALHTITTILDPKREDSIQKAFEKAVQTVSTEDGALVATVKRIVAGLLKPLQDEVDRLAKEIRGQDAAAEALAGTTAKGAAFEEELLPTIRCWAKFTGAAVDYVGDDNRPGDILVTLADNSLSVAEFVIVVEARDEATQRGKKQIADDMARALAARDGHYGVYVAKTQASLGKEIGDWAEGRCSQGPFVACMVDHLVTALRFAVVDTRLRALLAMRPEADVPAIQTEIERVRTVLRRIRTIKTRASEIHKGAASVTEEADELQRQINDALLAIENALRGATVAAPPV
jgi:hypothetical protein